MVARDNSIYNKSSPSGHSILKKRNPRSSSIHSPIFMHTHTHTEWYEYTHKHIHSTAPKNFLTIGFLFNSQFSISLYRCAFCFVFHFVFALGVFGSHSHSPHAHKTHFIYSRKDPSSKCTESFRVCVWVNGGSNQKPRWKCVACVCVCLCMLMHLHCIIILGKNADFSSYWFRVRYFFDVWSASIFTDNNNGMATVANSNEQQLASH